MSDYQAYNARVLRAETLEDKDGQYTLYVLRIDSSKSGTWIIERRYSEFVKLNDKLQQEFGSLRSDLPKLPPKKLGKMKSDVVDERKASLANYLNLLLIHIKPNQSETLKQFLDRNKHELTED